MTDQLRQAAQQARQALKTLMIERESIYDKAITALNVALAQEHAMHELARLGQEIEQEPLGSIALARQLCYQINGAADDSDDMDGGGYGSVDIAEILSAEVVRLQKALAQPEQVDCPRCGHVCSQRPWQGLTPDEVKHLYPYGRSVWGKETFEAIAKALKDKNT